MGKPSSDKKTPIKQVPVATVGRLGLRRIISGGQTGADQGALEGARSLKIKTGGWAPKGYRTENGSNPDLKVIYKLKEDDKLDYRSRTERNLLRADMTIILTEHPIKADSGTALTLNMCRKHRKVTQVLRPCKKDAQQLANLVCFHAGFMIQNMSGRKAYLKALRRPGLILNFAGPRESREPGLQAKSRKFVRHFIKALRLLQPQAS